MIDGYLHERFADAIRSIEIAEKDHGGIGTYNEKTLHAVLKNFFEPDSAYHEIPVNNYIADIKNSDGIIEIQTSGFGTIRDRLEVFLSLSDVTVVYPIAAVKSLVWIDPETRAAESKRKSPRRYCPRCAVFIKSSKMRGCTLFARCLSLRSTVYGTDGETAESAALTDLTEFRRGLSISLKLGRPETFGDLFRPESLRQKILRHFQASLPSHAAIYLCRSSFLNTRA